jgi:hypothetical protein
MYTHSTAATNSTPTKDNKKKDRRFGQTCSQEVEVINLITACDKILNIDHYRGDE